MSDAATRHLALDGVFNFRDMGGYRASEGRFVAWRRLFRADGLHRLSEEGVRAFEGLGIRTVIDLRTGGEIDEHGIVANGTVGVDHHHVPLLDRTWSRADVTDHPSHELIASLYLDMLLGGAERFAHALRLLAVEDTYPVVFHCAAGKDRTGVLAAIVLGALGVSDSDVVADYVLSRVGVNRWVARYRAEHPGEELPRGAQAMIDSDPETMRRFLTGVRERFGSPRGYVSSLPLPPDIVDALEARLLDDPERTR